METGITRAQVRRRLSLLLLQLPNLSKLVYRLLRDPRVSRVDKALLAAVIVYVLNPFDLMPDFIPFIGQVDDIYLVAVALMRMLNRTHPDMLRQHWDGQGDVVRLVQEIAELAVVFLPERLRNLLVGTLPSEQS